LARGGEAGLVQDALVQRGLPRRKRGRAFSGFRRMNVERILALLRAQGWRVGAHNDWERAGPLLALPHPQDECGPHSAPNAIDGTRPATHQLPPPRATVCNLAAIVGGRGLGLDRPRGARTAIVTCYAPPTTRNDHVHFVDGAAEGMPQQLLSGNSR
jgi:hypothetical protein